MSLAPKEDENAGTMSRFVTPECFNRGVQSEVRLDSR
jgi:hypothetical protein